MVSERVGDRRELARLLAPHLDRPGEMIAVLEAEAHDDMRHFRPRPIGEKEIEGLQLGEIVGALAPPFGEVVVASPVEVAHVGEGEDVAFTVPVV